MSKLLKLKEWLTLEQAVLHIANVINEPVTIADLYRFALDGHLKLSVNFVNYVYAVKGKWLKEEDIEDQLPFYDFETKQSRPNPAKNPRPNEMFVSGDDWISWEYPIAVIDGLWDLTMKGCEALDVEHYYQKLTSGLSVKQLNTNGVLVQQGDVVCQLYKYVDIPECNKGSSIDENELESLIPTSNEKEDEANQLRTEIQGIRHLFFNKFKKDELGLGYVPSSRLGDQDFVFVIRTSEITRFIQSLEGTPQEEKPLGTNERNTLLVLIAALCKEANVDWNKKGIAGSLVLMAELIGAPLSGETIRKILKQIEPAVSSRSK